MIYPHDPLKYPLYHIPPLKLPPLNTPFLQSPEFQVEFSKDETHLRLYPISNVIFIIIPDGLFTGFCVSSNNMVPSL